MSQQQQNDDYSDLWLTPRGLELLLRCKRAKEVKTAEAPADPNDDSDPDDSTGLTVSVAATVPESEVQPEESKPEPPLLREIKLAIQESRQRADEEARIRHEKVFGSRPEIRGENKTEIVRARLEIAESTPLNWGGPGSSMSLPAHWNCETGAERAQRQLLQRTNGWTGD